MSVDVALVYPPSCDPTAPYLAVPMLTGFLRAHGVLVLPVDANVEAYDALLSAPRAKAERRRLEARLAELDALPSLGHEEQLEYLALAGVRGDAGLVERSVEQAKATLRSDAIFDPEAYAQATATIDAALRVVSATHFPLHLDFTAYRTPLGLTSLPEIERAAAEGRDPFHQYVHDTLIPRLAESGARVIGISVCFPGQLQPAYAFAAAIKRALPGVHLTAGGPGVTQMLVRLEGQRLARALGPFDSAVLYEGERTLLALVEALSAKKPLRSVPNVVVRDKLHGARATPGHGMEDLKALPAPDFDGMPLDLYLSPTLVLPYDPTRGCYWGKCTFCHYGLAEVGTASYRERDVATAVGHLAALSERYRTRTFYLSQDSVAPKTIVKLAEALAASGADLRWATDLKPEKYLTAERAEVLKRGGAVACALGVESASPRVLELIDKGAPIEVVGDVMARLTRAGVAAEAMCFTDFPTESYDEAMATLRFLAERRDDVAVYIVGEFGLTHGSLVAQSPERFDIAETWELEGDELGLGVFFTPNEAWKTPRERAAVDAALHDLSRGWYLRQYPWAGAVSTAHTILHYERFGPGVFRDLADAPSPRARARRPLTATLRYDLAELARAEAREAAIWQGLVYEARTVSREAYEARARRAKRVKPNPTTYTFRSGALPEVVPARSSGRRPSHATSSAR